MAVRSKKMDKMIKTSATGYTQSHLKQFLWKCHDLKEILIHWKSLTNCGEMPKHFLDPKHQKDE